MKEPYRNPTRSIARDYFIYLGKNLPQQCLSDEFYFLPRVEAAIQHIAVLDDLHPEKIKEYIHHVRNLLNKIPSEETDILEDEIDCSFLRQSMRSFIREFDRAKVWQKDPTLYIKIPLFSMENCLTQEDLPDDQVKDNLANLFSQIPAFLALALENIRFSSQVALEVAVDMTWDAIRFFREDVPTFISLYMDGDRDLDARRVEALEGWETFRKGLHEVPYRISHSIGEEGLMDIFHTSLSYHRTPEEILERARFIFRETLDKLNTLAMKIDDRKTWKQLTDVKISPNVSPEEVLRIYRREVHSLRRFFSSRDILSFPPGEEILVLHTPSYLLSLRATASYKAPPTGAFGKPGRFFITPGMADPGPVVTHSPYLAAHETYPGHHILDHIRIHHSNPIRRQIESPLYYEGWACYGEQLLDEVGYVRDPGLELIGLKRQLWRSLRAILDIELHSGKITPDRAVEKIESIGFSKKRAQRQVRRFCLTPGYQSCYAMGLYEILKLRERFSPPLGIRAFHDVLLGGGQIPFSLIGKRMEKEAMDSKAGGAFPNGVAYREKPDERSKGADRP